MFEPIEVNKSTTAENNTFELLKPTFCSNGAEKREVQNEITNTIGNAKNGI